MAKSPERVRYILLDGLRGLSALAIMIHHFTASSGQREVFASASIAVDFFFCLSGFVIAHAYHQRLRQGMGFGEYASRRLIRLYPMYLIGCVLGFLALALAKMADATDFSWQAIQQAALLNVLYIPYLNDNIVRVFHFAYAGTVFPLNNPAWSLFFGLFANAIYALLIRRMSFAPAIFVALSAIVLVFVAVGIGAAPGWSTANFVGGFPRVMFAFFAGVVIFQMQPLLSRVPRLNPAFIAGLAMMLLIVPRFQGHKYYWLTASLLVTPCLVVLAARCADLGHDGFNRLCTFAGNMSYPLFCIHFPLLIMFSLVFPGPASVSLLVDYVCACVALAHVFHRYAEMPARQWLGSRTGLVHP